MEKCQIYFVTGDDHLTKNEYIRSLIEHFVPASEKSLNLHVFYGNELSGPDIENLALSIPMLSDVQIILIREIHKIHEEQLLFVTPLFTKRLEQTIFILECEKVDERKKIFKPLIKKIKGVPFERMNFEKPYENQIPAWLEKRALNKYQKPISPQAIALLLERIGPDLYALDTELAKLACISKCPSISEELIHSTVLSRHFNIFNLVALIAHGHFGKAIGQIPFLLSVDPHLTQFLVLLHRRFLLLLKVKLMQLRGFNDDQVAKALQINLWFLRKGLRYCEQAQKFQVQTIADILTGITDLEYRLRRSGAVPKYLLEKWLAGFCN